MRALLLISLIFCTDVFAYENCGESLKALEKIEAHYPRIKERPFHKGRVVLNFAVQSNGFVTGITVVESHSEPSSTYKEYFEKSAIEAVKKAKFSASRLPCSGEYEVHFDLRS